MVMTPTQALLNELREFVEVFPEKARVNPFGVAPSDASFPQGIERSTSESAQAAQQVVRLAYVSLYSEHKNLSTLLKALPLLNGNGAGKYRLTTTADPAWRGAAWTVTHQSDMELARRPYIAPWIEFSGPLSECEVQQLYRNADIFVFPSFCESFGHPMVEAMAHGLPIVAADTPVNREICAGAALYFRPLDPGDLAEKVKLVGSDQALTEKLRRSGRHRVADFRWEDHVERLLQAAGAAPTQKSSAA
jgi:glycosyltransferase involved in cell wall biosynthesis